MAGKWSSQSVPHKGWTCTSVDDLGAPDEVCQMCETQDIRYVHHMEHPDYPESLAVRCICAEQMENDYDRPCRREKALRNAAQRKRRWLREIYSKVPASAADAVTTNQHSNQGDSQSHLSNRAFTKQSRTDGVQSGLPM